MQGLVAPAQVPEVLEEPSQAYQLGVWVLGRVCEQFAQRQDMVGDRGLTRAVNVTARQVVGAVRSGRSRGWHGRPGCDRIPGS